MGQQTAVLPTVVLGRHGRSKPRPPLIMIDIERNSVSPVAQRWMDWDSYRSCGEGRKADRDKRSRRKMTLYPSGWVGMQAGWAERS